MTKNDHRYQVRENTSDIKEIRGDIKDILRNHLPHIYTALENLQTDMAWLKKFFWIVATASIGALIVAMLNLLVQLGA